MTLLECMLIKNDCYKAGARIKPKGVMIHSTGANNPNIKRYVQPVRGGKDYSALIAALGKNSNGNHWNRAGTGKCVHAFIGKLADGSIATVQTLPWEMRGWHCASGKAGSGNNTHIAFEICEDKLEDPAYFKATYREAMELTAHLCKLYGLDPLADGVVICHKEGARRGIASDHADVEHWWPRMGYSMNGFRQDVADLLSEQPEEPEEAVGEMSGEEIYTKLCQYLAGLEMPEWAEREWAEAVAMGITDGTRPTALIPRYEAAMMALRAAKAAKG